jgi:uncharacterized protein YqeY
MLIKDQLMENLKVAMREKNVVQKNTITMLRAAIKQTEVDQRVDLEDEGVIEIIAKQIKQKRSAIEEFEKASREDLVDEAHQEIKVLEAYLPEQLSEEALKAIIAEAITETGATTPKEMGKVITIVSGKTTGRADGKHIATLVKELLSK